eukprot:scaffold34612_cov165-Amphora_coffeaeformis.AAC.23
MAYVALKTDEITMQLFKQHVIIKTAVPTSTIKIAQNSNHAAIHYITCSNFLTWVDNRCPTCVSRIFHHEDGRVHLPQTYSYWPWPKPIRHEKRPRMLPRFQRLGEPSDACD